MDTGTDCYGNGRWWLRSPDYYYDFLYVRGIDCGGDVKSITIYFPNIGVVPALQIRL